MIAIDKELDLIEVALATANDDSELIRYLLQQELIAKISDSQAQAWLDSDAQLWSVVVKPWVLVQLGDSARSRNE